MVFKFYDIITQILKKLIYDSSSLSIITRLEKIFGLNESESEFQHSNKGVSRLLVSGGGNLLGKIITCNLLKKSLKN